MNSLTAKRKKILLILCMMIVVVSLIMLTSHLMFRYMEESRLKKDKLSFAEYMKDKKEKESHLKLVSHRILREEYSTYITGEIRNNSNYKFDSVSISFNLYDENGNVIGTAIDMMNKLEENETWVFHATIYQPEKMVKYKLARIETM